MFTMSLVSLIIFILILVLFFDGWFLVSHKSAKIVERLGKFDRIALSGFHIKIPVIERMRSTQDLRINQLDVEVETKTVDNVFVRTQVSVQFFIMPDKIYESFYKLESPVRQIRAYIFDVVRSEIPKMSLDAVFANKDAVALAIKNSLTDSMDDFGFSITTALVTDIDPDASVKEAMNRINATEREKIAALNEAEAKKIRIVKEAEAEAESKRLTGQGYANLRSEISKGIQDSMNTLKEAGLESLPATTLILTTQYLETLEKMSSTGKLNTILLPGGAGGADSIREQLISALKAVEQ